MAVGHTDACTHPTCSCYNRFHALNIRLCGRAEPIAHACQPLPTSFPHVSSLHPLRKAIFSSLRVLQGCILTIPSPQTFEPMLRYQPLPLVYARFSIVWGPSLSLVRASSQLHLKTSMQQGISRTSGAHNCHGEFPKIVKSTQRNGKSRWNLERRDIVYLKSPCSRPVLFDPTRHPGCSLPCARLDSTNPSRHALHSFHKVLVTQGIE